MLEFLSLIALLTVGLVVFAILAAGFWLLKMVFKLLFIPLAILGFLLKAVLLVVLAVVLLAVAPVALVLFVVFGLLVLPFLLLAGLFGFGWAVT